MTLSNCHRTKINLKCEKIFCSENVQGKNISAEKWKPDGSGKCKKIATQQFYEQAFPQLPHTLYANFQPTFSNGIVFNMQNSSMKNCKSNNIA